jgi:beta-glucosidase
MGSSMSSATAARPSSSGASGMGAVAGSSSSSSSSSSSGAPYSSNADDKTLHETYIWSFYDAAHSGLVV